MQHLTSNIHYLGGRACIAARLPSRGAFARQQFITAHRFFYGSTCREAAKAYREADPERRALLIAGWKEQARASFYND